MKNEEPKILFYATCVGRELFAIKKYKETQFYEEKWHFSLSN